MGHDTYRLRNPKTMQTVSCVKAGVEAWGAKGYTEVMSGAAKVVEEARPVEALKRRGRPPKAG